MTIRAFAVALAILAIPLAVSAQDHHGGHSMKSTATTEAGKAFEAVNAKMHKDMTMTFTGNADVDFVRGMIPHHQGAIDMARVVLKYGKDSEIKKLAEEVIKAQDTEIAFMKSWLAKQPK